MSNKKHPFSLCCLSPSLEEREGIKMQTMTVKKFSSMDRKAAVSELSKRTLNNVKATLRISRFCIEELNIHGYRMSSGLFPLINYSGVGLNLNEYPDKEEIIKTLEDIGRYSKENGLRLSFHPGEYTTVTSDNEESIKNSLTDLEHHAWVMDVMGLPENHQHPINFHIRKDGDPEQLSQIAMRNIRNLSISCRERITLEVNDNKNGVWSVGNLKKYFYETMGIPVVFDSLHCSILTGGLSIEENMKIAASTWGTFSPLFHYSVGINGTKSHADYSDGKFPEIFYNSGATWDIELKAKCKAIKQLI